MAEPIRKKCNTAQVDRSKVGRIGVEEGIKYYGEGWRIWEKKCTLLS